MYICICGTYTRLALQHFRDKLPRATQVVTVWSCSCRSTGFWWSALPCCGSRGRAMAQNPMPSVWNTTVVWSQFCVNSLKFPKQRQNFVWGCLILGGWHYQYLSMKGKWNGRKNMGRNSWLKDGCLLKSMFDRFRPPSFGHVLIDGNDALRG